MKDLLTYTIDDKILAKDIIFITEAIKYEMSRRK
jgi:hypothetical protein